MADIEIRPFTTADIAFALAQTAREGWDTNDGLFDICLDHDPEGCFVAQDGGQPVGMVTTTFYRASGWIGNLIVKPKYRRRGIGARLMDKAIERLTSRGATTLRLEADPPGVPLYRRLGFVDEFESLRFTGPANAPGAGAEAAADETGLEVLPLGDSHLVADLDAAIFGDDRRKLLRLYLERATAAYWVPGSTSAGGYAMLTRSSQGTRLGPWVADDSATARALLTTILTRHHSRLIVGLPAVNTGAVRLLESFSFAPTPPCRRMQRGSSAEAGEPAGIYAIANGAMG